VCSLWLLDVSGAQPRMKFCSESASFVPADSYTAVCNFSLSEKGGSVYCGLPFQLIEHLQSLAWHIHVIGRGERE
jgi:hypothetical protein